MTIRDLPADTRDVLAARAARAGQSLQVYMRSRLIEDAARPTTDEWLASVRSRVDADGGPSLTADDLVAAVREAREDR